MPTTPTQPEAPVQPKFIDDAADPAPPPAPAAAEGALVMDEWSAGMLMSFYLVCMMVWLVVIAVREHGRRERVRLKRVRMVQERVAAAQKASSSMRSRTSSSSRGQSHVVEKFSKAAAKLAQQYKQGL